MRKVIIPFLSLLFFCLFLPAFEPQFTSDTDGGKILFQVPKEILISSIAGELTRCQTYMDYIATQGLCQSFSTKIGYVTDFSIGYLIFLWPEDYEAGDSFRWNFNGPNHQNITGGYDCVLEGDFYCWVSTTRSETCPSQPGKLAAFMIWSIYPQNFHRPDKIIGKWTVVVTKNGITIGQDSFTILPAEISDRQEALDEIDKRWDLMSANERSSTVSSLTNLNNFLGSIAQLTDRTIAYDIALAKQAYPQYSSFDENLAKAIIKWESDGNYLCIGSENEIGLGQERYFCDINKNKPSIKPYEEFNRLQKSSLSGQDFEDFKILTFSDDRSLVIQSISILFMHVTDELMSKEFIGEDVKKILAGYNWGADNLFKWIKFCAEENIDWYSNLTNRSYPDECYPHLPKLKIREKVYNYINNVLKYY